ncbi:DUF1269 domain-containing protein [Tsukamurella asaccharolytica]|uniref:DUF1269 domain-containing protein n=1 Tax=Tsukamurella asaccharolytica TaxID=2592067 RepID=A0A5C5REI5_9ACTN|nr:DUF1269 domain-containing protein [Tsukamurella asaccharolytica]TWS20501.1 DUF1269 domain-containing protein [Tsukamurella asaccharolytica]
MGSKNIILISWPESGPAYEAFSKFKDLDSGSITIDGSAVVERQDDGQLKVTDGQDNVIGLGTLGGAGLGTLIGILGGPLGVLLGLAGGSLVGAGFDVARGGDSDDVISHLSSALPAGTTAIIAEVEESDQSALDDFALRSGGALIRRDEDEVLGEISAAEDAADAAADAARQKAHEAKKEERKEKRDERVAKLKAKLKG